MFGNAENLRDFPFRLAERGPPYALALARGEFGPGALHPCDLRQLQRPRHRMGRRQLERADLEGIDVQHLARQRDEDDHAFERDDREDKPLLDLELACLVEHEACAGRQAGQSAGPFPGNGTRPVSNDVDQRIAFEIVFAHIVIQPFLGPAMHQHVGLLVLGAETVIGQRADEHPVETIERGQRQELVSNGVDGMGGLQVGCELKRLVEGAHGRCPFVSGVKQ